MYSKCWHAGLRQGSRIVELNGVSASTLTGEQLESMIATTVSLRALVIPPAADGAPRRGCEDAHCVAARALIDDGNMLIHTDGLYIVDAVGGVDGTRPRAPPR
jgi:hypothetical protein